MSVETYTPTGDQPAEAPDQFATEPLIVQAQDHLRAGAAEPAAEPQPAAFTVGDVFMVSSGGLLPGIGHGSLVRVSEAGESVRFVNLSVDPFIYVSLSAAEAAAAIADGSITKRRQYFDPATTPVHRMVIVDDGTLGTSGTYFYPGQVLAVQEGEVCLIPSFYRLAPHNEAILRILSHFAIPVLDDGFLATEEHAALVKDRKLGERPEISSGVRFAIAQAPGAGITRALLANAVHVVPPRDAVTAEAIHAWLDTLPPFKPVPPVIPRPPAARRPTGQTLRYRVHFSREVTGRVRYIQTDTAQMEYEIPLTVIARGSEAILEWLMERAGFASREEGDPEIVWSDSTRSAEDFQVDDTHTDIGELIQAARDQFPDHFDDDDNDDVDFDEEG